MRKIYLLASLLFIPGAVLGFYCASFTDTSTGYFGGPDVFLIAAAVMTVLFIAAAHAVRTTAANRGVPCIISGKRVTQRVLDAFMSMLILLDLLISFRYSRPAADNMQTVWLITMGIECLSLLLIYLRVIMDRPEDPVKEALLSLGPCLFFTADLLNRFFSSYVNRNNLPLIGSLLSCGALAVAFLRLMQTCVTGETSFQRNLLSTALFAFLVSISWRLPCVSFYLKRGTVTDIVPLACDCAAAVCVFYEACATLPSGDSGEQQDG